jgi:hypothetical protein
MNISFKTCGYAVAEVLPDMQLQKCFHQIAEVLLITEQCGLHSVLYEPSNFRPMSGQCTDNFCFYFCFRITQCFCLGPLIRKLKRNILLDKNLVDHTFPEIRNVSCSNEKLAYHKRF